MRALIVEDDPALAADLVAAFREAGFAVDGAADGEEAAHMGATAAYDVAILDIGLPGRDGVAVLSAWRAAGAALPVLALTARDAWADKARAFRAGADDYVTKPFFMPEVILRARSLIRRAAGHASAGIVAGALAHDPELGVFTLDAAPLRLTAFEARVLGYMIHHAGRVLSRTEISEHVYEDGVDRDFGSLEVVIRRLRGKIGAHRIETLRGRGYRLLAL
ncbi:MAG: DNA-binding response regulator [Rhodobacteraceae bacterium]|nr:MAG: DNA-binding response regulator [Paracoccaceae bacterium]